MEDPGTRFRYSEAHDGARAAGRDLVGQAVRRVSRRAHLRPLGMTDTSFWVGARARARGWRRVYAPAPGGGLAPVEIEAVPFTERPALLEGAVGLVSTVPDYLRFSQMLLNKGELEGVRLLSAEDGGVDDGERPVRSGAEGARRPMGWGLATSTSLSIQPARRCPRIAASTAGTDRRAPISGTIRRPRRSPS